MVFANLLERASSCLTNEGDHFEHLLCFKSYIFVKIYSFFTLSYYYHFFLVLNEVTFETLYLKES